MALSLGHIGFNQDGSCLAIGGGLGFKIYQCDPLLPTQLGLNEPSPIHLVEGLFRCNLVGLVGSDAPFSRTKVCLYDDNRKTTIGEMTFRTMVRGIRLRRDRIVVILDHKIYVYNSTNLVVIDHIETIANPFGICAISVYAQNVLACPGIQPGNVRIEIYDAPATSKIIPAHTSPIHALALNSDGTRLATASEQGTLIRTWNTSTGLILQELRRGSDPATIYSLNFNSTTEWLVCSSSKGTIHVFCIDGARTPRSSRKPEGKVETKETKEAKEEPAAEQTPMTASILVEEPLDKDSVPKNTTLSVSKTVIAPYLPSWLSSTWSCTQWALPHAVPNITAFTPDDSVMVLTVDGQVTKLQFSVRSKEAQLTVAWTQCILPPSDEEPVSL